MRCAALLLLPFVTACSFAHEYKSGEVPRLQVYDDETLATVLGRGEIVQTDGLRRDSLGKRVFVPTSVNADGPDRGAYLLTIEKGRPPTRERVEFPGPNVNLDKDGGAYLFRDRPDGSEVAAVDAPTVLVARSPLSGTRLLSKGDRHYVCGWLRDSVGWQGACDVFDSAADGRAWLPRGRLELGEHLALDLDPASDLMLVETPRDDLDPLLFTVDLGTWEWKYIGAATSWHVLFMNVDPLGRPQNSGRQLSLPRLLRQAVGPELGR